MTLVDRDKPGNPEKRDQKQKVETKQHVMLHCSLYKDRRSKLKKNLSFQELDTLSDFKAPSL